MKLVVLFFVLSVNNLSFAQCKCIDGNYSSESNKPFYGIDNADYQIIFRGYKERETKEFVYASEFDVINCKDKNVLLSFSAVQNCKIEKNTKEDLYIIETKKLPFGEKFSWIEMDYSKYVIKINQENGISLDTILVLDVPIINEVQKKQIYSNFNSMKNNQTDVTEEISYEMLLLALNGDNKAKDILFNFRKLIKLDGVLAEINSDAINIYENVGNHLK